MSATRISGSGGGSLPSLGPLDLSPIVGTFALLVLGGVLDALLGRFH